MRPKVRRSHVATRLVAIAAMIALVLPLSPGHAWAFLPDRPDRPLGANDWSCQPSAAHPRPVVLVHGMGANKSDNWDVISPLLAENGYCVFALTYGVMNGDDTWGGLTANEDSAQELRAFVDRVRASTGAATVDLVTHSEGMLVARYYTNFLGGERKVRRAVMLAAMWNGSALGGAAVIPELAYSYAPEAADALLGSDGALGLACAACAQVFANSPFLRKLNAGGMALRGIRYTGIMTRYDQFIVPYTSGHLDAPNVTNHVVQDHCALDFADHFGLLEDPVAVQLTLNALDPEHAEAPPCLG